MRGQHVVPIGSPIVHHGLMEARPARNGRALRLRDSDRVLTYYLAQSPYSVVGSTAHGIYGML